MKAISPEFYLHDSDKKALKALKEVPGFSALMKKFMEVGYEQSQRIVNMSTNLRVNENQLPHIYNMLPPICERLGIEIPELYIDFSTFPNAATFGDTKPYIIVTTGLLERFTEEEVKEVLAHECGHIACHHTLYHTIGNFVMCGGLAALGSIPGFGLLEEGFKIAYCYWQRCSEFSADRAAAIYMGGSDVTVNTMLRFSGMNMELEKHINKDEYLKQAQEYKEMVANSKWNKTLEFLEFVKASHPMNAVRANEIIEWCKSDAFKAIVNDTSDEPFTVDGVCPKCGATIIVGKKFCRNCGYKLIQD